MGQIGIERERVIVFAPKNGLLPCAPNELCGPDSQIFLSCTCCFEKLFAALAEQLQLLRAMAGIICRWAQEGEQ